MATLGLYTLVIVDASGWDRDRNSWPLLIFRLLATATFLWWAVDRTVTHWHEDRAP